MPTARYLDQPYLLAGRRIDPITGTLSYREVQKHLRRKELEVLALLAEAGGEQVPRSVFIEQVWQGNPIVGEQGLTDTVSALRRSLLDTDRENPLILTIPRRGYQLRASIRSISRDGGVAFVAGSVIDGRPDWRLKQLLEQTDAHESWLAEDGRGRRIFRFCRNEQQLRKLRREVVLMRYLREALASQENVSTILDWQLEEPPYFLELAAPACGNLRGVMLGKSVPELPERWRLMQEVAEALAAVHAAGVVHRALSPDSVLVDRRGGERVALLGEFGLAALDDRQRLAALGIDAEDLSLKTGLLGPATAYTAPECVAGAPASAASDVYALGVLIAQTLRGDYQRLESSGFEGIPDGIATLLTRSIATDPGTRPSAAQAAAGLKALTQPKPVARSAEVRVDAGAAGSIAEPAADTSAPVERITPERLTATMPEAEAPLAPLPHQRIGRYRIVSELAQGGMGIVYLAEQSEPVQRRVALKLIRAGLDSAQVLARFEAERQALALMNHPNISAIFDAGTTPGGYPYFVMEYVPGKDIKTYCDEAKLNLRARIRLFLQVCDGVLHAHQKGLIHRDLKPSNILVKQKAEQSALVKLIDFGVAKSLTGGLGVGMQTVIGSFIGTPVYSCPEQVIHPTRDIDTRADLYSLGVVLYELLTGVPPRSQKELDADTPAELARRLRDTKTPAMGSRFAGLSTEERQRIADFREMSEQGLSMDLGSDLDWIVGKCIAQDPDDRYATVQDLRLDLQRWLDGQPIEARPTSAWYRFRKMVRRNRLNTAIVVSATLVLIATTTSALIGYQRAEHARIEARLAATFQTERIRTLDLPGMGMDIRNELLRKLAEMPLDATVRASLEAGINGINFVDIAQLQLNRRHLQPTLAVIERDFSSYPTLQADLLLALAASARILGALDTAEKAQQRALSLAQGGPAKDEALAFRARYEHGLILMARRLDAEAQTTLENTLAGLRTRLGSQDPMTLQVMETLLQLRLSRRDPTALPLAREWIDLQNRQAAANPDLARLNQQRLLGEALLMANEMQEARAVLEGALARQSGSSMDAILLRSQIEIALSDVYLESGMRAESTELTARALAGYRQVLGERHETTLRVALQYSEQLRRLGNLDEATALQDSIIRLVQETYGENHPLALEVQHKRGITLKMRGQLSEARTLLTQLRTNLQTNGGGNDYINPWIAGVGLVPVLIDLGELDAAETLIDELLEQADGSPIWSHGAIETRTEYARLLQLRGQSTAAVESLRATIEIARQKHSGNDTVLLGLQSYFGELLIGNGQYAEAETVLEQTLRAEETRDFERRMRAPLTLARLASLRLSQQRHQEALQLSEEALTRSRIFMDEGDPRWKRLLDQHARILKANGRV